MTLHKARRDPERPPVHPGEILRDDVLPALNMPVSVVARHLGVTRQTLHRILAGAVAISPSMALRLGKFCGNGPVLWLNLQRTYDLWHMERAMKRDLDKIPRRGVAA